MDRNLIISGGIFHDFEDSSRTLADLLSPLGIDSTISNEPETALADLANGSYDMLTLNALRWPMAGEKYDPWRDEWALSLSAAGRSTLTDFVNGGGGLLGIHTAAICFSEWDGWQDLIGGVWRWGKSFHPPQGDIRVTPTEAGLNAGLDAFPVNDERYSQLDLKPGLETLLVAEDEDGIEQPLVWRHTVNRGRAACDVLGHDSRALRQPMHTQTLQTLASWILRRPEAEVAQ